jgi:hypothetical protein
MNKGMIIAIIGAAAVAGLFTIVSVVGSTRSQPVNQGVQVLDVNVAGKDTQTDTVSGRVVNSGNTVSHPIMLQINVTELNRIPLLSLITSPEPSIMQTGQEATYSKDFIRSGFSDPSYDGPIRAFVTVVQQ